MTEELTSSLYYVWYNVRDENVVEEICEYVDNGPDNGYFKYILFTGGAGTGKTRVLTHLSTVPGYCFMCPTNMAGEVLKKELFDTNLYGSKTYKVDATIFKHYQERKEDKDEYMSILKKYAAEHQTLQCALQGTLQSLSELFTLLTPVLDEICYKRFHKPRKVPFITPQIYAKHLADCCNQSGWIEQFRTQNEAVVQWMLAFGKVSKENIPTPLLYEAYVIDEAGRVNCLDGLLIVHYYKWVHKLFQTGCIKAPSLVCVGSCTQNKVINDTPYDINNYSLVAMVSAPFLRMHPFYSKINIFNRRCNGGNVDKMACVSNIVEHLECDIPITDALKKEFLSYFSVPFFMPPNSEVLEKNRKEVMGMLHIAKRHELLTKFQELIKPQMNEVMVTEHFICTDPECNTVPRAYRVHERLGSCYKSVKYNESYWTRVANNSSEEEGHKYINTRPMSLDMLYQITHYTKCQLIHIDGSIKDFLDDMGKYKSVVEKESTISCILVHLIRYLTSLTDIILPYGGDRGVELVNRISNFHSYVTLDSDTIEDIEVIHILQINIMVCLGEVLEIIPENEQFKLKLMFNDVRLYDCQLFQGMYVTLEDVKKTDYGPYLIIKLGKTMRFKLTRKKNEMRNAPISGFEQLFNTQNNNRKRSRGGGRSGNSSNGSNSGLHPDDPIEAMLEEEFMNMVTEESTSSDKASKQPLPKITIYFFPLALAIVLTIDRTQSASFRFNHIIELTNKMCAEDCVVAFTRTEDTDLLKVHDNNWSILPLEPVTKQTQLVLNQYQCKVGWL